MHATIDDRRQSDSLLAVEGLRLTEAQERREILRRQVAENTSPEGWVRVFDLKRHRFRAVTPSMAMLLCGAGLASVASFRQKLEVPHQRRHRISQERLAQVAAIILTLIRERGRFPYGPETQVYICEERFPDLPRPRVGELFWACRRLSRAGKIRPTTNGWREAEPSGDRVAL